MAIDLLRSFLDTWDGYRLIVTLPDGTKELVTQVALKNLWNVPLDEKAEDVLIVKLHFLKHIDQKLDRKIQRLETFLSRIHDKKRVNVEEELGLTTWDGGPGTSLAKERILECYLMEIEHLDLDNLNLTSLPNGIQKLKIDYFSCSNNKLTSLPYLQGLNVLRCDHNELTSLPEISEFLTYLNCSNNKLTSLPDLPFPLETLECMNNYLTVPPLVSYKCDVRGDGNPFMTLPLSGARGRGSLRFVRFKIPEGEGGGSAALVQSFNESINGDAWE